MLHAGDLDRGRRGAGQGREHNAAQRIAERDTVAALKRLYGELAVGAVRGSSTHSILGFSISIMQLPSISILWSQSPHQNSACVC